jgi:hypothetical protein
LAEPLLILEGTYRRKYNAQYIMKITVMVGKSGGKMVTGREGGSRHAKYVTITKL